ncbi:Crp/Fnr family transcriptional regulator [Anaerovorax sp. IOR16]|uniref:Crp/Fnr family transcriptional regulator n=1 Tax=Anaerovorax sp. IOR16 TaxID=2773458 RepID=UPI0019D3033E|nr:Crp/Fnr family transcriptional regulator [Anaerovorax sp. IOR16]
MNLNSSIVRSCPLFSQITENEMDSILKCLSAKKKVYQKNTFIISMNHPVSMIGVIVKGSVNVVKEDFWGNRTILTRLSKGDLFGEAFSCAQLQFYPVSVITTEETEILFLDYKKIIKTCSSSCRYHIQLIQNMLQILAKKNILLTQKIEHITKRTTKEKLLSYLSSQAIQAHSQSFKIPFNRQELADYLSVDRSAMSNELCKLRDEGLLTFHRNYFELKE